MLTALFLATVLVTPTPVPTATPPPEIYRTVVSPMCSTLRNLALPVGYVTRKNDSAFRAMSHSLQTFLSGFYPTDVPTQADLEAVASASGYTGSGADAMGPESGLDDQLLYGPGQVLTAADIDGVAQQIFHNIVVENSFMQQSWKEYPKGVDPNVDAMRQQAQNVIDLQRALADRYEDFAQLYLSNQGMAALQTQSQRAIFKQYLRALLLGDAVNLNADGTAAYSDDGFSSTSERAKLGSVAQVVRDLTIQERSFAQGEISSLNVCNGTHIIVK
jgi:hypothetical protein